MRKQITFTEVLTMPKQKDINVYKKQKWRNMLQAYCDKEAKDETNAWCICGYMDYCNYCCGIGNTNACVKAICKVAKENNIKIDYTNYNFEKFLEKLEAKNDIKRKD